MKTILTSAVIATALVATTAVFGSGSSARESGVTVQFHEPENFTDFRLSRLGGTKEQQHLSAELTRHIQQQAERYLPPQYRLELRINDIDMAGDFEEFLPVRYQDTRIIRGVYIPRVTVDYAVTNEAGEVVQSGSRNLTNLSFDTTLRTTFNDEVFHESNLLNDFIRELGRSLS